MPTDREAAEILARALANGAFEEASLLERALPLAGKRRRWAQACIARLLAAWDGKSRPTPRWIAAQLLGDERFFRHCDALRFDRLPKIVPVMSPAPGAPQSWRVPALTTPGELAAWLGVSLHELRARADCRGSEATAPDGPMRNYRYAWRGKRSGAARLIESPKPRLKNLQRQILDGILNAIPPHAAAHGFRPGGSAASFAAPHVGKRLVLRMDLVDFFPSLRGAQVKAIFYTAGYPEAVAQLLAGLCWNAAPDDIWLDFPGTLPGDLERLPAARRYRQPHLPQGAPTSPALANLCVFRLDCRLAGLARSAEAVYTRYADDLSFSGDNSFARVAARFASHVAAVAIEEGLAVHPRKTRLMPHGARQLAAGIVVNKRLNAPRREYERLKAILHRSAREGPLPPQGASFETYRAHLRGKIAWMAALNPHRGERLLAMYQNIAWPAE